jgi:hypothetical protein
MRLMEILDFRSFTSPFGRSRREATDEALIDQMIRKISNPSPGLRPASPKGRGL